MSNALSSCPFCQIVSGVLPAAKVFEDERTIAFLDTKPLFVGHLLLIPKAHLETLYDLSPDLTSLLFANAQRIGRAVETAMEAEGSFVAMNNRISQSVPHFHVHIVPRRKGDGLKGFFWPRTRYESAGALEKTAAAISSAIIGL